MAALAPAGLCIGIMIGTPIILFKLLNQLDGRSPSSFLCDINAFANAYFSSVEAYTIVLVNINILVEIYRPLRHHQIVSLSRALITSATVWTFIASWVILARHIDRQEYVHELGMCVYRSKYGNALKLAHVTLFLFAPMFIVLAIYLKLYWLANKHFHYARNVDMLLRRGREENKRVTKTFLVTTGFFIRWLPLTVCSFII